MRFSDTGAWVPRVWANRLTLRPYFGGRLVQAGPDRGGQPLETLAVPGRAARLGHQVIRGAVDAVREHGRDPAVRVVAERQLGPGGQAARDRLEPPSRRRRAQ